MARRGRFGGDIGLSPRSEELVLGVMGRFFAFITPWLAWPLLIGISVLIRKLWPNNIYAMSFFVLCGIGGSIYIWTLLKDKVPKGNVIHSIATVSMMFGWFVLIDTVGKNSFTLFCALIIIPLVILTWSIRSVIKHREEMETTKLMGVMNGLGLGRTKVRINPPTVTQPVIQGKATKTNQPSDTPIQVEGDINLDQDGIATITELDKKLLNIESSQHLPPGTIITSQNPDDANVVHYVLTDPRVIREPRLWNGPSMIGASISDPIVVGIWQNIMPVTFEIPNQHFQIMGMTGSGKSLGACWSFLAETITRKDVAIVGIDITKGNQTLGPFRNSLNRLETDKIGAADLLGKVNDIIKPRTDYLAEMGLGTWEEGCGLTYLVVWMEEVPLIVGGMRKKDKDNWTNAVKAARSAGIGFVLSLQRSTFDEIPTLARGQMARWCFGLSDPADNKFGLSQAQRDRGADASKWGQRQPGMFYLDSPAIPENLITMPGRTNYWGPDNSMITTHAEQYPVSFRDPVDKFVEQIVVKDDWRKPTLPLPPKPPKPPMAEPSINLIVPPTVPTVEVVSPQPAIIYAPPPVPKKATPAEIRSRVNDWLREEIDRSFTIQDLRGIKAELGIGQPVLYKILGEMEAAGLVVRGPEQEAVTWYPQTSIEQRAKAVLHGGMERAKKYGVYFDPNMTAEDIMPLFNTTNCPYCGVVLDGTMEIDHRIPLSRGGTHAWANLCAACKGCNRAKSNLTSDEYMANPPVNSPLYGKI